MSNLFSIFDPVANFGLSLNWGSALIVLLLVPGPYWKGPNQMIKLLKTGLESIVKEFKSSLNPLSIPGMLLISVAFLINVVANNFMGLYPYIFTASSHALFTLSLALPFWVGHMLLAATKTPNHMFAHLVPLSTPNFLIPFMVIIEIVSSVIRPMTLSVRLAANMIAGHLLLALLGGQGFSFNPFILTLVMSSLVLLMTLEVAVSLIQSYVFSVLSTLYVNEVNSPQLAYLKKI